MNFAPRSASQRNSPTIHTNTTCCVIVFLSFFFSLDARFNLSLSHLNRHESLCHCNNTGLSHDGTDFSIAMSSATKRSQELPWYRKGGMLVNSIGMAFNICIPVIIMASNLSKQNLYNFIGLLLCSFVAAIWSGRRTVYCIVVVPTFMASLLLVTRLNEDDTTLYHMVLCLFTAVALAIFKVNICMSVCLHRYAAHAAFKCGPITQVGLGILGCLANQGGPIWWASQHQCHHKNCDVPGDPHSAILSGTEQAFGFFQIHDTVVEEFAPAHLDSTLMRVIDTWAFTIVALELWLSYQWMGCTGLFLTYTSGWICQTITLWFNITNHPTPPETQAISTTKTAFNANCKAGDYTLVDPWNDPCMKGVYLPFVLLNALVPLFGTFVMEREHAHHHDHPRLAKRAENDSAYWSFVYPLEQMGLVWNVVVPTKKVK